MPTALSVANNEGAEVVGGTASALPVFYDRTGRRPRYVVAVVVEKQPNGFGGSVAAPIAKAVMEKILAG